MFCCSKPGTAIFCSKFEYQNEFNGKSPLSFGGIRLILLVSFNKPNLDLSNVLDLFKNLRVTKKLLEERNGKGVCFIFMGLMNFHHKIGRLSIKRTSMSPQW